MSQMLNRVILTGRLVRDPELRQTSNGNAVASFTLAVGRDYRDKDTGEIPVDFVNVVAWRHVAEFVSQYFGKGKMAVVEGRLQVRDWADKDGNKRHTVEVVASSIYFAESAKVQKPVSITDMLEDYEPEPVNELPF